VVKEVCQKGGQGAFGLPALETKSGRKTNPISSQRVISSSSTRPFYTVESIDGHKIYVKNEEGAVLGKFFKPYQLVKVDSVEKYEKPNESHEEEHKEIQRARKHQRVLKAVGIDQGNVVEGKRERKRKEVFDW